MQIHSRNYIEIVPFVAFWVLAGFCGVDQPLHWESGEGSPQGRCRWMHIRFVSFDVCFHKQDWHIECHVMIRESLILFFHFMDILSRIPVGYLRSGTFH